MEKNTRDIVRRALAEDIGDGDHSSLAAISPEQQGEMQLIAKEPGIIAGLPVAKIVLQEVDSNIEMTAFKQDGDRICRGDIIFILRGSAQKMLSAERTLLNFLQRMSGIATSTRKYADKIHGTCTRLLDTRKTTPTLRIFEKYAVSVGGGSNHRFGLYDMIMLKDNHIDFAGGISKAIDRAQNYLKTNNLSLKIEIETRDLREVEQAVARGGIQRIMLDNFSPEEIIPALTIINGLYETEASGQITLENILDYARTGVNYISVGALTHHIKSLDMSLKFLI
ncbi:MAG: carboxylating nicotinate-nucleotide diphosphorylase [Bacteroidales bacterium]|nr:carboxylating nicotinate-nucleotide diphosphorylase [Bacteroidales bacterium]